MQDVHALFVHGVGAQRADFANDSRRLLRAAVKDKGAKAVLGSVHWAPLFERLEGRFLANAQGKGSRANMMQRFVVGTLADAIAWQSSESLRIQATNLFWYEWDVMKRPKLTIVAHSLGCMLALEALRRFPEIKVAKFVTLGCNVGLFEMGRKFECPAQVSQAGSWVNLYDPSDCLGFALNVRPDFAHVEDHVVQVGSWLWGWTGLAHVGYFGDRRLFSKTIPDML